MGVVIVGVAVLVSSRDTPELGVCVARVGVQDTLTCINTPGKSRLVTVNLTSTYLIHLPVLSLHVKDKLKPRSVW